MSCTSLSISGTSRSELDSCAASVRPFPTAFRVGVAAPNRTGVSFRRRPAVLPMVCPPFHDPCIASR
eukprot:scaffold1486_cov314-Pavlova_lutheri.AAC.11